MLRRPSVAAHRQQSKDEVQPSALTPAVSQGAEEPGMDTLPAGSGHSARVWTATISSVLCWPVGRGRPLPLSLSPPCPGE